ncbi:hypothetical protein ACFX15_023784 [Malus domestica]
MRGRDVLVWVDKWLPSLPEGHMLPRGGVLVSRNTRVGTLICTITKSWDIDFMLGFISQEEMVAIRDIEIWDLSESDKLVWPYDKRGRFTVKSGYHCEHSRATNLAGLPISHGSYVSLHVWKTIWKLNTPPKLRHFVWKSIHGALPRMANLFRRKLAHSSLCPI